MAEWRPAAISDVIARMSEVGVAASVAARDDDNPASGSRCLQIQYKTTKHNTSLEMRGKGVHLVLLIHGLYGSPQNLDVVKEELLAADLGSHCFAPLGSGSRNPEDDSHRDREDEDEEAEVLSELGFGESHKGTSQGSTRLEVIPLVATSFTWARTWDGVDVNAHRAAEEVDAEIERLEGEGRVVEAFSVMGYSLGGLVGRYLVGLLHAREPSFFERHRPASFSTAATPHLGQLRYGTRTNALVHKIGKNLFSRSGKQLFCLDRDLTEDGRPVLEVLADPGHIFLQALKLFPRIQIVANGIHDLTVPYPSATFSLDDPFDGHEHTGLVVDTDRNHIVQSWRKPSESERSKLKHDAIEGDESGAVGLMPSKGDGKGKADASLDEDVLEGIPPRPALPPFLLILPWPFTYLIFLVIPLVLPLWLMFISSVMILHTYQSRQRHRQHERALRLVEHSYNGDGEQEPLVSRPRSRMSLYRPSTSSASTSRLPSRLATPSQSRVTSQRASPSGTSTPPLVDPEVVPDDPAPILGQTPFYLTRQQKLMALNLQRELPQVERLVSWFPWAFNAHALLICRSLKSFKAHERGRGVVKAWAKFVVESGGLHTTSADQGDLRRSKTGLTLVTVPLRLIDRECGRLLESAGVGSFVR